ncbi:ATP-binding protein [Chitinophaga arvensicola]|uniref:Signal transduction histidine kinase n=1 Tax=Chitinophaga arvensicola TaxID=29529 RepID=A0A1I0S7R0_9BACT|nr:sensor histidine kinase [Chitinophaga arvensicola]SEW51820.1 Signal transduction histidine kinase [Chitinophaga arvensicola]
MRLLNRIIYTLAFLAITASARAQLLADSLRNIVAQPQLPLEKRIDAMDRLGQVVFFNTGWKEGLQILRESLSMAAPMKDGQYRAHTYGMMAASYYITGDATTAYNCMDSAWHYIRHSRSGLMKGYVQYMKGWLQSREHQETAAIHTLQEALDILEKEPDGLKYRQAIYSELGGIYFRWYDLLNVEKYTRLSLEAANRLGILDKLISANQERGSYFINLYRSDNSQHKALDSALFYMRYSLQLARANRVRLVAPSDIPFSAIGIANIFLEHMPATAANKDSIDYYNKIALEEGRLTKQFAVEAGVYNTLANMAYGRGDYNEAIEYLYSAIATSMKDPLYDKYNLSQSYFGLAEAFEQKKDTAMAFFNYKQYMATYQELFDVEKMNKAKDLEAKYEMARKEKALLEIRLLAELRNRELIKARYLSGQKDQALLAAKYAAIVKDNALLDAKYEAEIQQKALTSANFKTAKREQELKSMGERFSYNRKLNRIYSALTIALFLAAAFLFYAFKQRSKALRQKQLLHELELDKINQAHRMSVLSAMLEGQETERTRLARDLHDGLGGLLSGVKIELSALQAPIKVSSPDTIVHKTMGHLDNAVDELRRIAKSMMPEVLLTYGLGEAIKEYCNGLRKSGVPVSCQVYNYKNDMSPGRQVTLYRIVQELVNNAIKHAGATEILVQLQQRGQRIFLVVEDDGKGFDTTQMQALKGAGLANIQSRVEMLHGTLEVTSAPGTGAAFNMECSVNQDSI